MDIQNSNANTLPFKPGDWVKVIRKPKHAIAIQKGDVIQIDQVSPSRQMIRVTNPDTQWEYLSFDDIKLTLPPPEPVGTGTTDLSVRDDKPGSFNAYQTIIEEIQNLLNQLPVSVRTDIIEKLLSVRDDINDNQKRSQLQEYPKIIWKSPGGREAKYPWFECGGDRAYIGGGDRNNPEAQWRVKLVQAWIAEGIPPSEIADRVRQKNFTGGKDCGSFPTPTTDEISAPHRDHK